MSNDKVPKLAFSMDLAHCAAGQIGPQDEIVKANLATWWFIYSYMYIPWESKTIEKIALSSQEVRILIFHFAATCKWLPSGCK